MFRSLYHERKNHIDGIVLMVVMLLCTSTAFIFLRTNVTGRESDEYRSDHPSEKLSSSTLTGLRDLGSNINHGHRVKRLPQAIIIGTRKSGTRALIKFLQVNPAACTANKEVHFFDKPQNFEQGFDWYRNQMPPSRPSDITIEKSPAYFVTPGVPERVKQMNFSVKLVLIFRDPVTRLISDYSQLVANKIEAEGDGQNAIVMADQEHQHESDDSDNRTTTAINSAWIKAGTDFEDYILRPDGGINDQRRAIRIGMYSMYLERWRSIFSIKQFHFVDGENLIKNPYEELHKLELFLGLEPTIRPENFVFNSKKGFYCLLDSNHDVSRGSNDALVKVGIKNSNDSITNCLSRSKGRRHVVVRRELIEELYKFYAPYNQYLFSLTGTNFSWPLIK